MSDQLKNLLAQMLTGIGMYFVGRGWVTAQELTTVIIPGALGAIGLVYSIYLNTRAVKVAAVATPGTTVVLPVSESKLAASLPDNVVTK